MKAKATLALGGTFAGLGVALGAFAAHCLQKVLSPQLLNVFQTGVQYQFIHALAIIVCGTLLATRLTDKSQKYFALAANCFIIGIFCFSGSLYAIALTGVKWLGPITPFGGLAFMLGWGLFVLAALQIKEVDQ